MKKTIHTLTGLLLAVLLCNMSACGGGNTPVKDQTETAEIKPLDPNLPSLPFRIEFVEMKYTTEKALPRLQSYASTLSNDGMLIVMGGRRQGLHTFMPKPVNNFIRDSSNQFIFVIDPQTGAQWSFDARKLSSLKAAAMACTNQQFYHDRSTGNMYIVGGYGWNEQGTDMLTFNTIMSFNTDKMIAAIKGGKSPADIESLISIAQDDRLAVTGGELVKMGNTFYLVFGQLFNGQYRAFGGNDFTQKYLETVKMFTLVPNSLKILSYGESTNTDADHPFHRRDGNIVEDIDPSTGSPRISSFGGVFQPGIIAPYTYPIYINGTGNIKTDRTFEQKFSQYECPVISVYDSNQTMPAVYHTFFGGIGHYYYSQTDTQRAAYDIVTKQGRNDGFPFVADISTVVQKKDGTYAEYLQMDPVPGNRLLGSSILFIENPAMMKSGMMYENGVLKLQKMQKNGRYLVGYIYGGVEAINPLPLIPNTGTKVSNTVFAVYVSNTPANVYTTDRAKPSNTYIKSRQ
ncbi:MAG: hypothetical protein JNL57_06605 [Bacteroidetes bacterium]|nr:hypothetical protein [Bacteroidota bacterium]